jgi:hypothetical protein
MIRTFMDYIVQSHIKNEKKEVFWRSITSGEIARHIIGSGYQRHIYLVGV